MWKIDIETTQHNEIIDITDEVQKIVRESKVTNGLCTVYVPHTTAAVTVNENTDPSVKNDIIRTLDRLVPWNDRYTHLEGNAAAHIKASIIGSDRTFIIRDGQIVLGTWQGIFFCEFDGPRRRKVYIEIVPGV